MEYDQIAHNCGMFVGLTGVLWMRDVNRNSAVFVERGDVGYDCFRCVWYKARAGGMRRLATTKYYVREGSFHRCVEKAKSLISFFGRVNVR